MPDDQTLNPNPSAVVWAEQGVEEEVPSIVWASLGLSEARPVDDSARVFAD